MTPTLPIKTLHGTSWSSLCEDYDKARIAVEMSLEELASIEFNARDYTPELWEKAVKERQDIYEKLLEVRQYLMDHAIHLS